MLRMLGLVVELQLVQRELGDHYQLLLQDQPGLAERNTGLLLAVLQVAV